MNDERFLADWLKDEAPDDADPRASADRIMARIPETPQRRRWWPFGSRRRASRSPSDDGSATITGRTTPMFSATKAVAAGVIVAAVGGALLIAQPFDQHGVAPPGAEVDAEPVPPVEFRLELTGGPPRRDEVWAGTNGSGGDRWTGGAWEWRAASEPTDGRFAGTVTVLWNHDEYPSLEDMTQGTSVSRSVIRIEDEAGAWTSMPVLYVSESDEVVPMPITLIGDGAYGGLYAIGTFDLGGDDENIVIAGLVFAGDPPPVPEPLATE